MPNLVIIDGNSLVYRAFFALPDTMKTSKGLITNALYGFTMMLLKIIEESPDHIIVAFDLPAPTFRHKEYKLYKATREKAPDKLIEQFPMLRQIVSSFDIPIFELEGYEADDIIGTIARKAEKEGLKVEILTGDLDALQLVTNLISVVSTKKGITDIIHYDAGLVMERFGIKPCQVADYKGLKGDTSDNIPGVPGIGEKTAVELLKEFGTLENVLANIDKIKKNKVKETLSANKDMAILSKRLATIVQDVPIDIIINKLPKFNPNWDKILPVFENLEFKTLVNRFKGKADKDTLLTTEKKIEMLEHLNLDYKIIDNEKDIKQLVDKLKTCRGFAVDTETTSLNTFEADLLGISICFEENSAYYIKAPKILKEILEDETIPKYGHNIKYDAKVLANHGINLAGITFDTMIAAYLLDPTEQKYNLKFMGKRYLDRDMLTYEEASKDINSEDFGKYACSDADVTFQLKKIFDKSLKEKNLFDLFSKIEMPLVSVLIQMELNGVYVDSNKLNLLSSDLEIKMKRLETDLYVICGCQFNLNSPKQLADVLFNRLKLPIGKRTKTGPSTDATVLEKLAPKFEVARKLLEYRTYSKVKSTYIDVLPTLVNKRTGRIHTSFNQTITATGRLSSSEPNMQNIPLKGDLGRQIRKTFAAQNNDFVILSADYSQIELRVLAHLSCDPELIAAFEAEKDIHRATAAEVYGVAEELVTDDMRGFAKAVNFGIIYGMSEYGLAKQIGVSREEARIFIDKYFSKHTGVKNYIDKLLLKARENGFVTTMMGRRRYLPQIDSLNRNEREFSERIAVNTPIQGSAADIIKAAMIEISSKLTVHNSMTKMTLQVHDELVFEVHKDELEQIKSMVEYSMINTVKLNVPLKVDINIGDSWG